jgi:hypothetical protein
MGTIKGKTKITLERRLRPMGAIKGKTKITLE